MLQNFQDIFRFQYACKEGKKIKNLLYRMRESQNLLYRGLGRIQRTAQVQITNAITKNNKNLVKIQSGKNCQPLFSKENASFL
jgi:hypothetical protein